MTRVLSGAVLLVLAVAVVWFAPPLVFFVVAELLLVLACREYRGAGPRQRAAGSGRAGDAAAAMLTCAAFAPVALGGVPRCRSTSC